MRFEKILIEKLLEDSEGCFNEEIREDHWVIQDKLERIAAILAKMVEG